MFQIEKGVPVPERTYGAGHGRPSLYPFRQMKKGDSFAIPLSGKKLPVGNGREHEAEAVLVSRAAYSFKSRHGGDFTVRTLKDAGVVRVWKVAA